VSDAGPTRTAPGGDSLPRLLPRPLAPEGSLTGDWIRGEAPARGLLPALDGALDGGGTGLRLDPGRLHASTEEAARRLEGVAAGEGVLVTTGQQPVLFLGPLFVLYKALTALETARRLRASGTPAVALFWVAGDDHDWGEVGRCRVLDTDNRLRTLRLDPPSGRGSRSVGPTPLPQAVTDLLDDMEELLPSSEFVGDYLGLLRGHWRAGRPVAEAFGATLGDLLGDRPFAWVDASSAAVREASAPLIRRAIEQADRVEEALEAGGRRVREAGYDVQMPPRPGGLPVFVEGPDGRRRLYRRGGDGFSVGRDGDRLSREEVLEVLLDRPEAVSPSGELRPVLESWLLPVAATVLGPSELAYWAQLDPLFSWAGVGAPRVSGRRSWVVLESKVGKVLEKLGAGPEDVRDGGETLAGEIEDAGRPSAVDEALDEARREVAGALERVEASVADELPGIRSAVGAARHGVFEALDGLEDAVDARVRERHEVLLRQVRKAAVHLHPDGGPQERVLSPFYYLARYGSGFVDLVERATREADRPVGGDGPAAG
jgi:bacillithiol biosynthesis cysteine-adding enzyme BshC